MTRWLAKNRATILHCLLITILLLPASQWAAGLRGPVPHPKRNEVLRQEVEKLEQDWRTAQLNNDVPAMDHMLADDYIGITMNGEVVTKMQQLDRIRSREVNVQKLDLEDVKVKLIGSTAVVTSLADVEGTIDGRPIQGKFRYTRVYTHSATDGWKITNFEATPVGMPHPRPMSRNSRAPEPTDPQ